MKEILLVHIPNEVKWKKYKECKRQIDKTHMISGELDLCIGLGDLWPVAVAGRDSGLLDTLWLDGCLNPGLGAGASYKEKKFLHFKKFYQLIWIINFTKRLGKWMQNSCHMC